MRLFPKRARERGARADAAQHTHRVQPHRLKPRRWDCSVLLLWRKRRRVTNMKSAAPRRSDICGKRMQFGEEKQSSNSPNKQRRGTPLGRGGASSRSY